MAKEKEQPAVVAQTVMLPISKVETNHGQVEGLPKNPRVIRDEQFKKLKQTEQSTRRRRGTSHTFCGAGLIGFVIGRLFNL